MKVAFRVGGVQLRESVLRQGAKLVRLELGNLQSISCEITSGWRAMVAVQSTHVLPDAAGGIRALRNHAPLLR
jgi:hypothetical protein